MKKSILLILAFALLLATPINCGYRLGSLLPSDIKTIAVPMFINKTNEPELDTIITNTVIQEFIIDGTLEVTEYQNADTILIANIIDYQREPLRFSDTEVTTEYRLILAVEATFKDLRHNEVMWEAPRITGKTTFFVGASLPASEKVALPDAAQDLAHHIVEKVVEGGW